MTTAVGTAPPPRAQDRLTSRLPRPMFHVLLLLGLYLLVIGLGDARAWSGSDPGGKVATIKYMHDHHTLVPEVGYWAGSADPSGTFHPLIYTTLKGGHWVQVTSLPFVYAGLPLYDLAGARGLLVLPVLGSLLAALAARRLARRLGSATGWSAFWLVGAASPMLFYAGDFWEHSAAAGLAVLAVVLALEASEPSRPGRLRPATLAGLAAGVAASLRSEVIVYAAVFGLALMLFGPSRRAWLRWPAGVVAAAAGFALPLVMSRVIERAVLGVSVSGARAGSMASGGGHHLGQRLHTAWLTSVGVIANEHRRWLVLGSVLVGLLVVTGWQASRRRPASLLAKAAAAAAGGIYLYAANLGLGFVPGLIPAAPAAMAAGGALGAPRRHDRLIVLTTALLALPLIWLYQWQGDLAPQWGGRYELVTGALLTVVGAVVIEEAGGWRRPLAALLVAMAVGVTAFGAAWHIRRTRSYASALSSIEAAPGDVTFITTLAHLPREDGAFYGDHRWLTAGSEEVPQAATAARRAGVLRLAVVEEAGATGSALLPGWRQTGTRLVPLGHVRLVVWSYARDGA